MKKLRRYRITEGVADEDVEIRASNPKNALKKFLDENYFPHEWNNNSKLWNFDIEVQEVHNDK